MNACNITPPRLPPKIDQSPKRRHHSIVIWGRIFMRGNDPSCGWYRKGYNFVPSLPPSLNRRDLEEGEGPAALLEPELDEPNPTALA